MNLNFTPRGAGNTRCALAGGTDHCSSCLKDCGKQNTGTISEPAGYKQRNRFSTFHLGHANKKLIEKDQAVNYIQQKSQIKNTPFVPYFKLCMKHPEIFPCFSNKKQSTCDFVRPKNISLHFLHVFKAEINPTSMVLCSEKLSFFFCSCVRFCFSPEMRTLFASPEKKV
jgi:hypothetical protein